MIAKDPEFTPDKSGSSVTIIINQTKEGWGDEDQQERQEFLRSEEGKVARSDGKGGWGDSIPEAEVIESTETGTCAESVPCAAEEEVVSGGVHVKEHSRGGGETWRQGQHRAQWFSELPDDE